MPSREADGRFLEKLMNELVRSSTGLWVYVVGREVRERPCVCARERECVSENECARNLGKLLSESVRACVCVCTRIGEAAG